MKHGPIAGAVIALLASAAGAGAVQAQEASQARETGATSEPEVVIVTATRRTTELQDTPLAVSALSGVELEDRGIVSVGAAVQLVPGVQLTNNQPGNNEIIIRGVGTATGTQSNADSIVNSTTAAYLDQVPISSTVQKTPDYRFIDLARVEVLRGPQGTLYGQSAMGGVVRYITNKPSTEALSGRVNTFVSSTDNGDWNKGVEGHVNIPLGETAALRLVGYGYDNSGFIDVIGTTQEPGANDENTYGGRAAFRWTPNDRLTVDLTALYNKIDLGSIQAITATYPVDFNPFTPAVTTPVSTSRLVAQHRQPAIREASIFSGEFNYKFDGADATLILARKNTDVDTKFEAADIVGLTDVYLNNRTINSGESDTIEFRLASTGENRPVDWIVGVYREKTTGTAATLAVVSGNPTLLNIILGPRGPLAVGDRGIDSGRALSYEELSFFGEATLHFTDKFDLTLGARTADVENDYRFVYARGKVEPAGRPALVGRSQAASETVATYKVNLSYKATPDLLFYLNAASGYRPGGFNFGTSVPVSIPDTSYTSDSLWNYELGVRSSLFNKRLVLNAAVYRIDWSDIQLSTIDLVTFYSSVRNVSRAEINGFELEAAWKATDNLSFALAYTYSDATVTGPAVVSGGGVSIDPGDPLPGTPENAGSLLANWRSPIGSSGNFFTANATYRYVGDRVPVLGQLTPVMEAYSLLDLRTGIELKNGIGLSLFADNVTNEVAVTQFIAGNPISYQFINRPRTIGVAANLSF